MSESFQTEEEGKKWSPVWLMPIIALMIAAWLGWKAWEERGITIKVVFIDGNGIEAGRTPVRFNGLQVGRVESVKLKPDLKGITARIQMQKEMEPWLTKKTRFWLVHPEISMAGITGLDTLLSGNYITLKPGAGQLTREFQALEDAPPLAEGKEGLHIRLLADDASSLIPGSPVYYRRIAVGEVEEVALASKGHMVRIDVYIKPEYANLVRKNSRFWNISGVHISGAISRLQIQTDSLLSILKGGIAFSTPGWEPEYEPAPQGEKFHLYSDYDSAKSGIPIQIEFPLGSDIVQEGARIMFHGVEAGMVKSYSIKNDLSGFIVDASMNPQAHPALVKGTSFWIVEPRITPRGVEGMDALLSGRYVAMDVTIEAIRKGEQLRTFAGSMSRPAIGIDTPGLHLKLFSDALEGISEGSEVWLRGITIGSVSRVKLHPDKTKMQVEVSVHIEPEYQSYIREGIRFWKIAGFSFSGGLSGFEFTSRPLDSMISGGISCDIPNLNAGPINHETSFTLYPSKSEAFNKGRKIILYSGDLGSIQTGNPVLYRGVQVGEVAGTRLANPADRVEIELNIEDDFVPLVTKCSRFWNVSGIDIDIGLFRGIQVQTTSILSLLRGGIAFATPHCDSPAPQGATFVLHDKPKGEWSNWNPPIELKKDAQLSSLSADK
ncbi:MlaD family protein [Sansalvadorimonas sp. 2012CJ34-2]|uniref:MlaD family protein n=1 Tax=Parendozoicomonas callyspongiae TaxID=2942213 RepID=A0ABT0PB39_9GAMM|nr:MlaD family protein [Sansalvadorimonas sp. 2012CJ34-2]MCL6268602.1 MlaD family protein [Sansalvadorimonas sp. 2012CJ34-2]